jgi:DNA-binding NtrC family response regulator
MGAHREGFQGSLRDGLERRSQTGHSSCDVRRLQRPATATTPSGDPRFLREMERRHVLDMLRQAKGNKVLAAKILGISRRALYRLISKYHFSEEDLHRT